MSLTPHASLPRLAKRWCWAFLLLIAWLLIQPLYVNNAVSGMIPENSVREGSSLGLVMAEVRRAADGLDVIVGQGMITEDYARSDEADPAQIGEQLREAGQVVTSCAPRKATG